MPTDPPSLIGRAAIVADAVRRARGGQGSVFTGPSGSGGSRLLDETRLALRRVGARTARLRVPHTNGGPASSVFLSLLDRPALESLPAGDRGALRAAILDLRLTALAIEDAHLLDAADGALVVEVARAGTVVVANATGPGGMVDALRLLTEEGRVLPLPLGPLTDAEVAELAEEFLGDPIDGGLAHALTLASAGRPGTLSELVDDGIGSGAVVHEDGVWHLVAPLPPARSIRTAVVDAVAALPPDQRGWIAAISTAGVLALDLTPRIAAPATVAAAEEAGWTFRDATSTRIRSYPVAAAVVGSLDLRARVAVLRRLIDAVGSAQRPLTDEERVAVARWRIQLGDLPEASEALELALRPGTPLEDREALLRAALDGGAGTAAGAALADHLRHTRRPREAIELIAAALPGADSDEERVALIRVASMTTGIVERRSREALDALDAHLATRCRHLDLVAVRAGLLLLEGRPLEAVASAREVLDADERSVFAAAFAQLQVAVGLRELGDLHGALAAAEDFLRQKDVERAYPAGAALAPWIAAEIAVAAGLELEQAEAALTEGYEAAASEQRTALRPPFAYSLGCIRAHRADPVAAARLLREADGGSGPWREGWRPRILAELTIAQALAGALDDASATHARLLRITCPPVQLARVRLATAQLLAARGDAGLAAEIAAGVADEGRRQGLALDEFDGTFAAIRYGDPAAPERLLALGTSLAGAGRDAQRGYASALLSGDGDAVADEAQTLWDAGLRLHAIEATARAAELGSTSAGRRLVALLTRSPGLQLPRIGERRGGLTLREREVALLAAGGNSDRSVAEELGITVRTAQTHLARALAKLGVHRRTDLRDLIGEP